MQHPFTHAGLALVFLLSACGEQDSPHATHPIGDWYLDADGDGFGRHDTARRGFRPTQDWVSTSGDCDDDTPDVFPGAMERCNSIDDNCDGGVDEGVTTRYYLDSDGDGFGDRLQPWIDACEAPLGQVSNATDCDDTRLDVNPSAPELCNGLDDDCDPNTDERVLFGVEWHLDADGDGYGDPAFVVDCLQPDGYIADGTDCDDDSAITHVGATEICDGLDNDCDPTTDENDVAGQPWYRDDDQDNVGAGPAVVVMCDRPIGGAATNGDCDDSDPSVYPGAVDICDGLDNDCDPTTDENDVDGQPWYPDNDGDGVGAGPAIAVQCDAPINGVSSDEDCDDSDPSIYPGAEEGCDGVDNNCSGVPDDSGLRSYFADADGDGFGDPATVVTDCQAPMGMVDASGDCDDSDPDAHPLAPESCGAGDDCNPWTVPCEATCVWVNERDGTDGASRHESVSGTFVDRRQGCNFRTLGPDGTLYTKRQSDLMWSNSQTCATLTPQALMTVDVPRFGDDTGLFNSGVVSTLGHDGDQQVHATWVADLGVVGVSAIDVNSALQGPPVFMSSFDYFVPSYDLAFGPAGRYLASEGIDYWGLWPVGSVVLIAEDDTQAQIVGPRPTPPSRVAVGPRGDLFVLYDDPGEVVRFDGVTGTELGVFVAAGAGGLDTPVDLHFDVDGSLLISDPVLDQILRFDADTGVFLNVFTANIQATRSGYLALGPCAP